VSVLIAPAKAELAFVIDGGGSAITAGVKGHLRVPFGCFVDRVTLTADQVGSIQIDIWRSTYADFPPVDAGSITGGHEPAIVDNSKYDDSVLTAWSKSLNAGEILAFNVDSAATITRVTVNLQVRKR
jgi:hypothetical protein